MRLFFAIEVPTEIKARIAAAQERMASDLPPKGFRIVKEGMLHVTLAFVGEVNEMHLPIIKERAKALASAVPRTRLVFEGVGCFPAWKHPRVIWIGVVEEGHMPFDQKAPLASLGRALSDSCLEFSDHKPEERVLLHVTLARAGDRLTREQMKDVSQLAAAEYWRGFGETVASSVVLFESTLGKSGPVQHVPIARFPLEG